MRVLVLRRGWRGGRRSRRRSVPQLVGHLANHLVVMGDGDEEEDFSDETVVDNSENVGLGPLRSRTKAKPRQGRQPAGALRQLPLQMKQETARVVVR